MIYLKLIYNFLIIGLLSFGGGYSTIPLVKDIVDKFSSFDIEMLENFIAISESTPGPIAINLATFVGVEVAGILGGVLATFFEILPAFILILIVAVFFKKFIDNEYVKFALSIIRPCIVGIIMSVGITMFAGGLIKNENDLYITKYIIIAFLLICIIFVFKKILKKKLSSIQMIIIGAILGIAINYLL